MRVVGNLKERFHLVHVHSNNCSTGDAIELSFENKNLGEREAAPSQEAQHYPLSRP